MATTAAAATATRWAASGWLFFVTENFVLSENRARLIELLGDDGYHAAYGVCSTLATASIAYTYRYKLPAAVVGSSTAHYVASWMILSSGLALASQTAPRLQVPVGWVPAAGNSMEPSEQSTTRSVPIAPANNDSNDTAWKLKVRCPFDFAASSSADFAGPAERITRHPGLWSFAMVGAAVAVRQHTVSRAVWWMGPMTVAALGGAHTDSRYRRGMGGQLDPDVDARTSNVPFAAIVTGQQGPDAWSRLFFEESKPLNAMCATAVAAVVTLVSRGRVR